MLKLNERRSYTGGFKSLGGLVGGIATLGGIFIFIATLGASPDYPSIEWIRYGSLCIAVGGLLVFRYSEKMVEDKEPEPTLDGLDALTEVERIAVKTPLADYSRGSLSLELLCKKSDMIRERKAILKLVGKSNQTSFELITPANSSVVHLYSENGDKATKQNQLICVLTKEYDSSWWQAIPSTKKDQQISENKTLSQRSAFNPPSVTSKNNEGVSKKTLLNTTQKLEQLKDLYSKKLISKTVYEEEQKELLKRL